MATGRPEGQPLYGEGVGDTLLAGRVAQPEGSSEVVSTSICPVCRNELRPFHSGVRCVACRLTIPSNVEDAERLASSSDPDSWGLYAFYGRLHELIGRRVDPHPSDERPGFTAEDNVIVMGFHPPNTVTIAHFGDSQLGSRGLSQLKLHTEQ